MDVLSALKMVTGQGGADKLGGVLKDIQPKTIPLQDLAQLKPSSALSDTTPAISGTAGSGSFQNLLSDFVGEVNSKQLSANDALTGLMSGKNVSLHQAMISVEEAGVSFQMMVEVRNKILESYQELMRMQV